MCIRDRSCARRSRRCRAPRPAPMSSPGPSSPGTPEEDPVPLYEFRVTPGPGGPRIGTIDLSCCGHDDHHMAIHAHLPLTDAGCEEVAVRFRALSEPLRLKILRRLFRSEASVNGRCACIAIW